MYLKKILFGNLTKQRIVNGLILGIFIGLLPLNGIKAITTILLALMGFNVLPVIFGIIGITIFPILTVLSFRIGELIYHHNLMTYSVDYLRFKNLLRLFQPTEIYLLGSIVVALALSIIVYLFSLLIKTKKHFRSAEEAFIFLDPSGKRWKMVNIFLAAIIFMGFTALALFAASISINPYLPKLELPKIAEIPSIRKISAQFKRSESFYMLENIKKHRKTDKNSGIGNKVFAFYVNWDPTSKSSLYRNISHIDYFVPEWLHLSHNGRIVSEVDKNVLRFVKKNKAGTLILINNYHNDVWDAKALSELIENKERSEKFINELLSYVKKYKVEGVNIDFEGLDEKDKGALVDFMELLYSTFKKEGLIVTEDIPAQDDNYSQADLSLYNDYVILMAYDEHSSASEPGPIASTHWIQNVLDESDIPESKLIVGIGNYGLEWVEGKQEKSVAEVTFSDVMYEAQDNESRILWDKASQNPYFTFDGDDGLHKVWFLDAASMYNQLLAIKDYNPRGVALWRLGSEDPSCHNLLANLKNPDKALAKISRLHVYSVINRYGDGEILEIKSAPKKGERAFELKDGFINNEQYLVFPAFYNVQRYGSSDAKIVSLTFDDGPDPQYTPKILHILKKEKVPAAFFVVGKNVENEPEILAWEAEEGHIIGNHTFTHPNVAEISRERTMIELNATQRIIEEVTGHSTVLFRPPYVADSEPSTPEEVLPIIRAQQLGYITVGESIDSEDWRKPGVSHIVQNVLKGLDRGHIVLMHDAGGNRIQTVKALPIIIRKLKEQGYRFVPLSYFIHKNKNILMPPVNPIKEPLSTASESYFEIMHSLGRIISYIFMSGIIIGLARIIILGTLSTIQWKRSRSLGDWNYSPKVSVIIAAYNEEQVIERTVKSVQANNYPDVEIIIIDDGSTDDTLGVLSKFGDEVVVIAKENGGKSSAINAGIQRARSEFLVFLDADTILGRDAIRHLVKHFKDPEVYAVSGNVTIGNQKNLLTKWQNIEYITGFNLERRAYDLLNCITVVPGAIGAWRKEGIIKVGLYKHDTLAEDTDLTIEIRKMGKRILYEDRAKAYTEAPENVGALIKQRFRWAYGTLQCLWKHSDVLFRPKYGTLGFIAFPNMWIFQVVFQLISPLIDLLMVVGMLSGNTTRILVYYLIFMFVEILTVSFSYKLENKDELPIFSVVLQRIFYRQLMYFVIIKSIAAALKGNRVGWNKLKREGSVSVESE